MLLLVALAANFTDFDIMISCTRMQDLVNTSKNTRKTHQQNNENININKRSNRKLKNEASAAANEVYVGIEYSFEYQLYTGLPVIMVLSWPILMTTAVVRHVSS